MKLRPALPFAILVLIASSAVAQQQQTLTPLSDSDRLFVTEALRATLANEELGRLAQISSAQPTFINYGKILERDPSRYHRDLRTVARRHGVRMPIRADYEDRIAMSGLLGLRGGDFETLFKETMVRNQQEQLDRFREAATEADAADVRRLAALAIPQLESQLLMAQNLVPNRSVLFGSR